MLKLCAAGIALVLILACGAYEQQSVPQTIRCGTVAGGTTQVAKGIRYARAAGRLIHKWSTMDAPDDADVAFYIRGVAKDVLWYWVKAFLLESNGQKIDPQILKLEQGAADADKAANDACTPCPPQAEVPDVPGTEVPDGPPVDSLTIDRPPVRTAGAAAARKAASAYWSGRNLDIAVAVAGAESGWKPTVRSPQNRDGSYDHGEWQINSVHRQLLARGDWRDINMNAWMAYQVFHDAGNRWTPWTTYKSGSYKRFMPAAAALPASLSEGPTDERRPRGPAVAIPLPSAPYVPDPVQPGIVCQNTQENGQDAAGGPTTAIADTRITWPVPGRRVSTYKGHTGVDINRGAGSQDLGDKIVAAASGVVTHAGYGKGYGQAVFIKTDTGYLTIYGHMSKVVVRVGQRVESGDHIGNVGSTGNSSGPHLHFEVQPGSTYQTALRFLEGKAPNRNGNAVAASSAGSRKVTDRRSGVTYSIPIPAGQYGRALNYALDQVGKPYVWGSHGPNSFDCSGLVGRAWQAAGAKGMPAMQSDAQRAGLPVVGSLKPGVLLWKKGHIQMYVGKIGGETLVVEAARPGVGVVLRKQWMTPRAILDPGRISAAA